MTDRNTPNAAPDAVASAERLAELERVIEGSLRKYVEIGKALKEIRDGRLHLAQGFKNFELYCAERWGWQSRQVAYNYINAAQVAENVQMSGHQKPSFSTAVEIASLPAERWPELLKVVESGGKSLDSLSVRDTREIVQQIKSKISTLNDAEFADSLQPVTRPGDLWLCGEHRLLCGDSTDLYAVKTVLGGQLAEMAFSDPPYNVNYTGKTDRQLTIANDNLGSGFYDFLRTVCANILSVTADAVYICMASCELHTLYRAFTDAGGHWSTYVMWVKQHFTLGHADYQQQYEPILYGWREGADHYWCGDRDQGNAWLVNRPIASLDHPTVKPVDLVERAVRNSSRPGDTVLDLFGGSGTTMIASENLGRRACLIELDPTYCDVAVRRWQTSSGKTATLVGDGRTFAEIEMDRLREAA